MSEDRISAGAELAAEAWELLAGDADVLREDCAGAEGGRRLQRRRRFVVLAFLANEALGREGAVAVTAVSASLAARSWPIAGLWRRNGA